jgi:hypothetical protein
MGLDESERLVALGHFIAGKKTRQAEREAPDSKGQGGRKQDNPR